MRHRQQRLAQQIVSNIEAHGFFIMGVFDPEGKRPHWAYTIGLHRTNPAWSDIIVIGLSFPQLEGTLRVIAQKMLMEGVVIEAGQTRTDLTEGEYPCFFGLVDPVHYEEYVGQGINYYAEQSFPLLQCVWSDAHKHFPWQQGFEEKFRSLQPLLFNPARYVKS